MDLIDGLNKKYPGAQAWAFGDSPEMANALAALVVKGVKTATCCSLASFNADDATPGPGSYHIILNGQGAPVCVIRIVSLRLMRFSEVTEAFARKEGEGDLSLDYWREEHKAFFTREGVYADDMELVAEEFVVVEVM